MKRIYKNLLKTPLLQKLVGFLVFIYLKFVYISSRKTYLYPENFEKYSKSKSCIIVFWHNRTALIPFLATKGKTHNALISSHSDGIILQNIFRLFGVKIILGSTNRGATEALREIMKAIKRGETISTGIDGPRGPKYQVNTSLMVLARKNKIPVMPVSYNCKRKVTLSSWDKMIIPLPFNNIVFRYGEVLDFTNDHDKSQEDMNRIVKQGIDSISDQSKDFA